MKIILAIAITLSLAACGEVGSRQFAGNECKNVGTVFQDVWINPTTSMVCN